MYLYAARTEIDFSSHSLDYSHATYNNSILTCNKYWPAGIYKRDPRCRRFGRFPYNMANKFPWSVSGRTDAAFNSDGRGMRNRIGSRADDNRRGVLFLNGTRPTNQSPVMEDEHIVGTERQKARPKNMAAMHQQLTRLAAEMTGRACHAASWPAPLFCMSLF
ncbi:hypothetical protein J6590_011228 [Homalodisca vitripennis]|nr:hypothetical protein J6590_011228 [Homalodisca vitripennis]